MKFIVQKDFLNEAVSFVVKLLSQRVTNPILGGVLLEVFDQSVQFSTFDYEVSSRTRVRVDMEKTGRCLISGRLLADIVSKLPSEEVTFEAQDKKMVISSGSSKFVLSLMPVDEYPVLPEKSGFLGTVSAKIFSEAISQISLAASKEDITPVITGVFLEFSEQTISLTATDRYRVAIRDILWKSHEYDKKALIPVRTLVDVGKLFADQNEINLYLVNEQDKERIIFESGDKIVTSLMIKGNYPPVKKLFPKRVEQFCIVNKQDLIEVTKRVAIVLERESALKYSFSEQAILLEALNSEHAQASEMIDSALTGEDITLSLKPQFFIDGLLSVKTEFVKISFTHNEKSQKVGPIQITAYNPENDESYKYLLQPNFLLK